MKTKLKVKKQSPHKGTQAYMLMNEVTCVHGLPRVHTLCSQGSKWWLAMEYSLPEGGPCEEPHSEGPWGGHWGEFLMAGKSEFSGCSLHMMGGCVCLRRWFMSHRGKA